MTRDETAKLLAAMRATYPNLHFEDPTLALDAWWRILEQDDGQMIMDAFSVYARTDSSGFAPSPGKLHSMIASRLEPGLTNGEVIGILTMASRNGNYGFQEEFNKLPPLLQKAVGSPSVIRNWGSMETTQLEYAFNSVARAYDRLLAEERISKASAGTSLERLENKRNLDALVGSVVKQIGAGYDNE